MELPTEMRDTCAVRRQKCKLELMFGLLHSRAFTHEEEPFGKETFVLRKVLLECVHCKTERCNGLSIDFFEAETLSPRCVVHKMHIRSKIFRVLAQASVSCLH